MQFKEGGIIGFDGTDGSKVEDKDKKKESEQSKAEEERAAQIRRDRAAMGMPFAAAADLLGGPYNYIAQTGEQLANAVGVPRVGRALGIYDPNVTSVEIPRIGRGGDTPFADMLRQEPAAQPKAPAAPAPQNAAPAPAPAAPPQQKPTVNVPAGAATGNKPPANIPSGGIAAALPKPPTMEEVMAGAQKVVPDFATEGERELRRIAGEKEAAMKGMPDLNAKGIAALEEARAARLDLMRRREERDFYNKSQAFFQDMARRTNSYGTVQEGIFARDEAGRLADLTHQEMVLKLQQAQQAQQLGQYDRAAALAKEVNSLKEKQAQYTTQAAEVSEKLLGGVYGKQAEAATHAADRASQERIEGAKMAQKALEMGDTKLANQISVANSKITDAYKALGKLDDDNKTILNMPPEVRKKAGMEDKYKQYVASRNNIQTNLIDPAISLRDSLAEKYGLPATKKVEAPSSNAPAVGTVMKGYRFKGGDPSQQANWEKV
jgi:hypothetical protein